MILSQRFRFICGLMLAFVPRLAFAQGGGMTPVQFHDRLVALIAAIAPEPMPPGDTSVSWTRGPVLYHTVAVHGSTVRSGLLRNDSLLGIASVTWDRGVPTSFQVRWRNPDSVLISISGSVMDQTLALSEPDHRSWPLPSLPWAIADYGMDEHVIPLLRRLGPAGPPQRIALFRPYGLKWDTVEVTLRKGPDGTLLVREPLTKDTATWTITAAGELLQIVRDTTLSERRPLEESRLYRDYRRLRITPPDLR